MNDPQVTDITQTVPTVPLAVAEPQANDILPVIERALVSGVSPEALRGMYDLFERRELTLAAQAFARAKAQFDMDCPPVIARTENEQFQVTRDGRTRNRRYASREDIEKTILAARTANGLSHSWTDTTLNKEDNTLALGCILTHVGGHERSSAMTLPLDVKTQKPSAQQVVASVAEFARRLTLINVYGLSMCDDDADGAVPSEPISANQCMSVNDALVAAEADVDRFKKKFKIAELAELPVSQYEPAMAALERQRVAKQAKKDKP